MAAPPGRASGGKPRRRHGGGYHRQLFDADPAIRSAAATAWCTWESATPHWPPTPGLDARYTDPAFALAFARLVTHYVRHDAWELHRAWPAGELVVVEDAGHGANHAGITAELIRATDRFAGRS